MFFITLWHRCFLLLDRVFDRAHGHLPLGLLERRRRRLVYGAERAAPVALVQHLLLHHYVVRAQLGLQLLEPVHIV